LSKTLKRSLTAASARGPPKLNVALFPSPTLRRASKKTSLTPKVPGVLEPSSNTSAKGDSKTTKRSAKAVLTLEKASVKRSRRSIVVQVEPELSEKTPLKPSDKSRNDSLKIKQEEKVEKTSSESTTVEATKNIVRRPKVEKTKLANEKTLDPNNSNQQSSGNIRPSKRDEPIMDDNKFTLEEQAKKPTIVSKSSKANLEKRKNKIVGENLQQSLTSSEIEEKPKPKDREQKEEMLCIQDTSDGRQPSPALKTEMAKVNETSGKITKPTLKVMMHVDTLQSHIIALIISD
jgi:hypothetical protein